jgi:pyruvate dehydrogenase E2 component (dihydrolipoamide acetyltransferase)
MATQILMPALSPTMEEGKLAKWLVKEGDSIRSGDVIAEIETDKATMEFEAADEGRIGKILVPAGAERVKVHTPIAILLAEGEEMSAATDISTAMASIKEAMKAGAPPSPQPAAKEVAREPRTGEAARIFASPLARRIAAAKGIDLKTLKGSGPRGRIVKTDVETATATAVPAAAAPVPATVPVPAAGLSPLPDAKLFYKPEEYDEIPNDMMRSSIAKRLAASAGLIPHIVLSVDCKLDELLAVRASLNAASPKDAKAYKLSVNDFVVKAAAMALMEVPEINASWTDKAILRHKHADVGVAASIPSGLITPIVARAEEKGLVAISAEIRAMIARAKEKKLRPDEYEGGSFSVSNLGMFGVKQFSAIINPPQSAILAVGAGEPRPVVKDGKLAVATVMTATLSLDHRVEGGAAGARFLQVFKQFIEQPAAMLL